ncbi:MAG: hypothetical protein RIQ79_1752, partial [Verrucomicrobiota bacterium]
LFDRFEVNALRRDDRGDDKKKQGET